MALAFFHVYEQTSGTDRQGSVEAEEHSDFNRCSGEMPTRL
jgi:hypothetical protein